MYYAATVWYRPFKGNVARHQQMSIAKLETAQRTAAKAILGTFCTTSTAALQIETSLPPLYLRLRNRVLQSWTRMQTTLETHPINEAIRRAISSRSNIFITPLEHLIRMFPHHTTPLKMIKPYPVPLWWSPPFITEIMDNKKSAKAKHDVSLDNDNTLCIYTDGSGINGHVGPLQSA